MSPEPSGGVIVPPPVIVPPLVVVPPLIVVPLSCGHTPSLRRDVPLLSPCRSTSSHPRPLLSPRLLTLAHPPCEQGLAAVVVVVVVHPHVISRHVPCCHCPLSLLVCC